MSSFTAAAGCSTDVTAPRCRIVPTFSFANGNVLVSLGPEELCPCTGADPHDDDERVTTLGGKASSGECFPTFNERVCLGGTGGGTVDDVRQGELAVEVVLEGIIVVF